MIPAAIALNPFALMMDPSLVIDATYFPQVAERI